MSAFNTIIATLEYRGIINRTEAEKLVDHINNHPQSANIGDAVETVTKLLTSTEEVAPVEATSVLEAAKPATDKTKQSATTKKK